MEKISTKNQLVRRLYNETSASHTLALDYQIAADDALFQEFDMLRAAKNALPNVLFNPSPSVLDRILAYSRETVHEPHC